MYVGNKGKLNFFFLPTSCAVGKNMTNLRTALLICGILVHYFSFETTIEVDFFV